MRLIFGTTVLAIVFSFPRGARAIDFDFESTPPGGYQGSFVTSSGGLGLTITPEGSPNGYVVVNSGSVPAGMGTRGVAASSVYPVQLGHFRPLRFTFSQLVQDITFVFGDRGGDDDSPVTIVAFNSTGHPLGSLNSVYPEGQDIAGSVSGSFAGAKYFIVTSGSAIGNHNSVLWEMRDITVVPEPASLLLVGLAMLGGTGMSCRRRMW